MASVTRESNGRKTIQFTDGDGKRKSVRLGKAPIKLADEIKTKIELLNVAKITSQPVDVETAKWMSSIDNTLADRLSNVGLIPRRQPAPDQAAVKLVAFIEEYITKRTDVKPGSRKLWRQTLHYLQRHFGADRRLSDITKADAKDFRLFLLSGKLAEATVRKYCGFTKTFLHDAVDRELIARNPFGSVESASIGNTERQQFVPVADVLKAIQAAPDHEWRLILALSRFGGLRCPSEHLALRWEDIHWSEKRITVRSPKTEHHQGHESRVIPLFPELEPYLADTFDKAEVGAEFVIARHRTNCGNWRTTLTKIIRRAGLKPWPRITHNLRSSRQTELESEFPTHVVCAWLGNSQQVARRHYLQVRDTDFDRAVSITTHGQTALIAATSRSIPQPAEITSCSALQNPVQLGAVLPRNASQAVLDTNAKTPVLQGFSSGCETVPTHQRKRIGIEPTWRLCRRHARV